ncbi:hypothetical protein VTL71DRAFT_11122 [Oculimacula yallundae]|uniref:Uncharacterized protein n=1 Tax=Oculimacula yallundae TaxID=86028 RepID=A0ABR4CV20_9HELO
MVEVQVYIMGVSLLLKSTSTSICICIQSSTLNFTSLHTLHTISKPKIIPIIPQSPPDSPTQTFETAPSSPNPNNTNKMSGTQTQTYTEEDFKKAQAILDTRKKTDKMSLSTTGKSHVFTRVSVICAEPGCDAFASGHEIIKLPVGKNYDQVGALIKARFLEVQAGNAKERANVRHCLWSENDHKIVSIKINWSGAHNGGWADNSETILTDLNCKDILIMMADRAAVDTMTVTISPK